MHIVRVLIVSGIAFERSKERNNQPDDEQHPGFKVINGQWLLLQSQYRLPKSFGAGQTSLFDSPRDDGSRMGGCEVYQDNNRGTYSGTHSTDEESPEGLYMIKLRQYMSSQN